MEKHWLRDHLKAIRADIDDRPAKDGEITCRLFELLQTKFSETKTLFTYVSVGSEVDTRAFIVKASDLYILYYPDTDFSKENIIPMTPRRAVVFRNLTPGRLGNLPWQCYFQGGEHILFSGSRMLDPPQITITPLLGFNKDNHRIGYGKGCYDRYFASAPGTVKIGLAYDEQTCDFIAEKTDIALDYIVTPTTIYEKGKNI